MAPTWGPKRFWRAKKGGHQETSLTNPPSENPPGDGLPGRSDDVRTHGLVLAQTPGADPVESYDLPQEDGFLGLYIRILLWQSKPTIKECTERIGPYSNRLGFYRPLEVIKIGEGASFNVFRRYDRGSVVGRDSNLVVMKNSKVRFEENGTPKSNDIAALRSLLSEIDVLSNAVIRKHRNIVGLLDIRWDHPSLEREQLGPTLYLEYAQLGTLNDFREAHPEDPGEGHVAQRIMLDICLGLEALHQCGITHGDVKPGNVLLFEGGRHVIAKLSDFGSAIFIRPGHQSSNNVVLPGISPPWDAPETGSEIPADLAHKSDIYSFGLLYWWYRLGDSDPFGVNTDGDVSLLGFKGDRHTKLDAFKSLKQAEDLGPRMSQVVLHVRGRFTGPREKDLQREAYIIGQATLSKDPSQRTLTDVKMVLAR